MVLARIMAGALLLRAYGNGSLTSIGEPSAFLTYPLHALVC